LRKSDSDFTQDALGARTKSVQDDVRTSAVVIHLDDLNAAILRLKERQDVTILPEFAHTTQDGRQGHETAIIDPDGHAILLYHIETAKS
jgi:hypothetical protein